MNHRKTAFARRTAFAALLGLLLASGAAWAQDQIPEPTVPAEWKNLDEPGLISLAETLNKEGSPRLVDRKLLSDYLAFKYLNSESATRGVQLRNWRLFSSFLGADMTADGRVLWRTRLGKAFVDDAAVFAAVTPLGIRYLTGALEALGDGETRTLVVRWTETTTNLGAADADMLVWLVPDLHSAGEAGAAARQKLVPLIQARYLTDAETTRGLGCERSKNLVDFLANDMTAEVRSAWATKLRAAFAADAQALSALDAKSFKQVVDSLVRLGDQALPLLVCQWMGATAAWQSQDPPYVLWLSGKVRAAAADGQGVRQSLIVHLEAKYLGSTASTCLVTCEQWSALAQDLAGSLSETAKGRWVQKLRAAFVASPESCAAFEFKKIRNLATALRSLGDRETGNLAVNWVEASSRLSSLTVTDLHWLLWALPKPDERSRTAYRRIAEDVESRCLASDEAARTLTPAQWNALVERLGPTLSPVARTLWASRIKSAYAEGGSDRAGLRPDDLKYLFQALDRLDGSTGAQYTRTWLDNNGEELGRLPLRQVAIIVAVAAPADRAAVIQAVNRLEATWTAAFSDNKLSPEDCAVISEIWGMVDNSSKCAEWAMRTYNLALGSEAARAAANEATLSTVYAAMRSARLTEGNGQEYPAFAQVVARLAREGKLQDLGSWEKYRHWGQFLRTPQSRQTLEAELVDGQGNPRLPVAKILACAYHEQGTASKWLEAVNAKLDALGTNQDGKALWLAAKAYAQAVIPEVPDLRLGKELLDAALAAAESEGARLRILEEHVHYYCGIARPLLGVAPLESVKGQFSAQAVAQIEAWQRKLREDEDARQAEVEKARLAGETAEKRALLAQCRGWLIQAQNNGDQEAVARLQETIQSLEKEVGK